MGSCVHNTQPPTGILPELLALVNSIKTSVEKQQEQICVLTEKQNMTLTAIEKLNIDQKSLKKECTATNELLRNTVLTTADIKERIAALDMMLDTQTRTISVKNSKTLMHNACQVTPRLNKHSSKKTSSKAPQQTQKSITTPHTPHPITNSLNTTKIPPLMSIKTFPTKSLLELRKSKIFPIHNPRTLYTGYHIHPRHQNYCNEFPHLAQTATNTELRRLNFPCQSLHIPTYKSSLCTDPRQYWAQGRRLIY